LLDELAGKGFEIVPGELGENILTSGIYLLGLPKGAVLTIGNARIELTGLRNPCVQLERHKAGLMEAVLGRDADGNLIRKCGVMGIVLRGGELSAGTPVEIAMPAHHVPLEPV
jgi:MOSC domain-containing protein YiiM